MPGVMPRLRPACFRTQVFTGAVIISPLLISIIWCLYNMIPPVLVLTYACFGRKHVLSFLSFLAMVASGAALVCSLGLVWWIQVRTLGWISQPGQVWSRPSSMLS